jgi:glucose-6-phosphate isomerase
MSNSAFLNWTHARHGRISGTDPASLTPRLGEAANLLGLELAAGRLPFIDMPYADGMTARLQELEPLLRRFEHMVVLGIGGSALGARALQKAFFPAQDRPAHTGPWLWIADNVDADSLEAWLQSLPAEKTVVVVISKSGGTIETIGQYFLIRDWLRTARGDAWTNHVIAVTDERSGFLREEADTHGLASMPVPDHLGGRYSVLSAVGLIPAAFTGMDWQALVRGAKAVGAPLCSSPDAATLGAHPAWHLAAWNHALMQAGYSQLIFFSYMPLWAHFGFWFAQLWAESLGKEGKGSMPLPAVGVTDQHSTQQMFLDGPRDKACLFLTCSSLPQGRTFPGDMPPKWDFLRGRRFGDLLEAEALGTRMALHKTGTPLVEIGMAQPSEEQAGRLMALLEITTLLTGWLLDINPLDQPAVELGKRLANARLGAPGYDTETADLGAFLAAQGSRQEF